jgi:hypothetical protein
MGVALFRRGLPCLADALFAERGFRVFFAKAFLAVGFFIEASVDIASTEQRKYRWGYSNCQVCEPCGNWWVRRVWHA